MSAIVLWMRSLGRKSAVIVAVATLVILAQDGLATLFHSASAIDCGQALIVGALAYSYMAMRLRLRQSLRRQIARKSRD